MSRMPPRTAKSPGSTTVPVREKPFSREEGDELVRIHAVAGRGGEALPLDQRARHHALQDGGNGGEQQQRLRHRLQQPRQRREPPRHDVGHGRDAVIGQAVPGGKAQDLELRGEIGKLVRQHGGALVIDRHMHGDALARRLRDLAAAAWRRAPAARRRRRCGPAGSSLGFSFEMSIMACRSRMRASSGRGMLRRHRLLLGGPGQHVLVGNVHDALELRDLRLA